MATSYTSTLLELVQAASEFASTDDEIVAAVTHLINSGNVLLGGTFAGARIDVSPRTYLAPPSLFHTAGARQAGTL